MKLVKKLLVASILATLSAGSAMAASVTGNFQSTATLSGSCIISIDDINFGTLTPQEMANGNSNNVISSGNVTCSNAQSYTLTLSPEMNFGRFLTGNTPGNTDKINSSVFFYLNNNGTSQIQDIGNGEAQPFFLTSFLYGNLYVTPDSYTNNSYVIVTY